MSLESQDILHVVDGDYVRLDGETTNVTNGGFNLTTDDWIKCKYLNLDIDGSGVQFGGTTYFTIGSAPIGDNWGNILIGESAGANLNADADNCILIGPEAGNDALSSATGIIAIGLLAGANANDSGSIYIGGNAGQFNDGLANVIIGPNAGLGTTGQSTYNECVAVGGFAGGSLEAGHHNTFVGYNSGQNCDAGGNNLFLGYKSGDLFDTESGLLVVDTYDRASEALHRSNAILYGVMKSTANGVENQALDINVGALSVGTNAAVDVVMTFKTSSPNGVLTWVQASDYFKFSDDIMLVGGENIVLDTSTGTQIGTATNQLLGFYGTTPVDQPVTVSDAATQDLTGADTVDKTKTEADLTSCKNAINAIIDRLQELGLVA